MILNLSTANHLYWLGRYVVRTQALCQFTMLEDDDAAVRIAAALALPAWNAQTLKKVLLDPDHLSGIPHSLSMIQDNAQSVRGVMSQTAFESFNHIWRHRDQCTEDTCLSLQSIGKVMADQAPLIQSFLQIGEAVETIDLAFRRQKSPLVGIAQLKQAIAALPAAWWPLQHQVDLLAQSPIHTLFYAVCDQINQSFTEGV